MAGSAEIERAGQCIMVGVDGSPASARALRWAAGYAQANQVTVVAVHVITPSAEFFLDLPPMGMTKWRRTRRAQLDGVWTKPLADAGVTYRTWFREADTVADGLIAAAADVRASLVVVGAHGHGGVGDRLLGGVTSKLVNRADRPLVIIPADWREVPEA